MVVFVDTSFLVSLFNIQDPKHDQAKKLSKKLLNIPPLYSNLIFAETVTILSQKVGKQRAIYAGDLMKAKFREIRIDQDIENLAWDIFKKQKSKNVSFVDCTTFALFHKGIFDQCFTFDRDFKANKIPVLE